MPVSVKGLASEVVKKIGTATESTETSKGGGTAKNDETKAVSTAGAETLVDSASASQMKDVATAVK